VDWALAHFCREGDHVNLLHVIPKCVQTPFAIGPLNQFGFLLNYFFLFSCLAANRNVHPELWLVAARRRYPAPMQYTFDEFVPDLESPEQASARIGT